MMIVKCDHCGVEREKTTSVTSINIVTLNRQTAPSVIVDLCWECYEKVRDNLKSRIPTKETGQ